MTKIIAHRGVSLHVPENTISAFQLAVKLGVDGIELDVQRTRDGVLVICHDQSVDRTTNGHGQIHELTWKEISRLEVKQKSIPSTIPERIPTLQAVLTSLPPCYFVNLELKMSPYQYIGIERQLAKELRTYANHLDIIVSSFNHESIRAMQKENCPVKTGILYEGKLIRIWDYAKIVGLRVQAFHLFIDHVDFPFVHHAHEFGYVVYVYGANTEKEITRMLHADVDGIITDEVLLAMRLRAELQRQGNQK